MTDLGVPFEKAGQPPNGPLVSIIVRTMGRAELGEALASLAVQTGTRVEVVVVDARGTPPVEFPAACGRFPVRVVHRGRHLGRSAAANAGLEEVTGDLLGFLDEDDLVDADHLDRLVRELVAHPDVTLAYAGVRTSTDGLQGPLDLNRPFDHLELMRGNFIPIHAALFRRRPVDEGCRFDEGLDAFEDWDFWLQLAERGPFLHVDRVSATYRVGGGSLIGLSGSDEERARGRASVYEKWKVRWSGEQIAALMQVPHSGTEKATGAVFDELRDHEEIEQQLQQRAAELDAQLRLLLTSWSWRLSRGLRELGLLGRRLTGMASGDHAAPFRQVTAGTVSRCFPPLPSPRVRSRPLISVVLPVYNACRTDTRFLSAAIESVARQTYPNLELLVIDDGSSDASAELCGALLARYPQLPSSLLRKQNGGQSSARNVGIARARGEWVSFIDQDDVFLPDKLTTVSRYLGGDVGVVYTDADTIGPDGRVQVSGIHRQGCGRPHPKRSVEDILFRDVFVMPGVMTVRRSLLNQVGGFDEELSGYEDDDLFLRLYLASPVVYLPVSTLLWRMHEHNYSQTERMLHSRSRYAEKLLAAYAAGGADTKQRERGIARRFYTEFLRQAAYQFRDGVAMYRANIAASRGLRRYLPLWDSTIVSLRW
ncbi:MAG TPA: glycosyltransferase family 2 protein, partial [Thermoanaerobaculaceae bacterium]|nr:glycosyltransferase family 2 protein [Thermoanaerobaculaceae bacterium]